jgi:hypothetical protein
MYLIFAFSERFRWRPVWTVQLYRRGKAEEYRWWFGSHSKRGLEEIRRYPYTLCFLNQKWCNCVEPSEGGVHTLKVKATDRKRQHILACIIHHCRTLAGWWSLFHCLWRWWIKIHISLCNVTGLHKSEYCNFMQQMTVIYSIVHLAAKNVHFLQCAPVVAGPPTLPRLILSLQNSLAVPQ